MYVLLKKHKKQIIAVIIAVVCFLNMMFIMGTYASAEQKGPEYMLKLVNDGSKNEQGIYQGVIAEENTTYVFSFKCYSDGGYCRARFCGNTFNNITVANSKSDALDIVTIEYNRGTKATGSGGNAGLLIPVIDNGFSKGVSYVWDIKLTKKGSSENLLVNPDFKKGSGDGWDINNTFSTIVPYTDELWKDLEFPIVYDKYMLKVENNGEANWQCFYQGFRAAENTDYVFSFDYYADEGAFQSRICGNTFNVIKAAAIPIGEKGTFTMEYNRGTSATGQGDISNKDLAIISIDNADQKGTLYIWNLKLTKKGSDENLLVNPDFKNGNSSGWEGNASCFSIVPYDETIWKTEEDTSKYMLKITNNGTLNWQGFYQAFTAKENTDYVFSFDYYADEGAFQSRICGNTFNVIKAVPLAIGEKSTFSVEYNRGTAATGGGAQNNKELAIVSIDNADQKGTLYVWNLKLTKKGSDENLLENPDFAKGKSTGWTGNTSYYSIIPYDENIWNSQGEDTSKYMLHAKNAGENWQAFYQSFKAAENTDYVYSFKYYVDEGNFQGRICGNTFNVIKAVDMRVGEVATFSVEYNRGTDPTGGQTGDNKDLAIITIDNGSVNGNAYIWDVSVTEKGKSENLLANPNFKNGKATGWEYNKNCFEIVKYDDSLWSGQGSGSENADDPEYMVEINGTYVNEKGETVGFVDFLQDVSVEKGKTYILTFNYYASPKTTALARIYKDLSGNGLVTQELLGHRIEGTVNLEYTATDTQVIYVGLTPGNMGYCYVWNFSFCEKGTTQNLLKNADFSVGDGSLYLWSSAGKVTSKSIKEQGGHKVVKFDRSLWDELVDKVQPKMEPKDPNTRFSFENVDMYYDVDHSINPNIQNDAEHQEGFNSAKSNSTSNTSGNNDNKNQSSNGTSPDTGDNKNITPLITFMCLCLIAVVVLGKLKKA